ncbi:MAG: hypothetical protein JXA42_20775 [Anaerolineales bacterium]|nr:hypothetical protein [Anaerolineales bacterium]
MSNYNPNQKYLLSIIENKSIIETVFNPENRLSQFAGKTGNSEVDYCQSWKNDTDGKVYSPFSNEDIKDGTLLLASEAMHYGTPEELLSTIKTFIQTYVDVPDGFLELAARYVMMSWVYDAFDKLPFLRLIGSYGTGKTRFLTVLRSLCYHSTNTGVGVTEANIFRLTSKYKGTLIIDEANFGNTRKHSTITQILNGSYARDCKLHRTKATTFEQVSYDLFGPKVLAAHQVYDDPALESRLLTCFMKQTSRTDIPKVLPRIMEWDEATQLRNKLLMFRFDHIHKVEQFALHNDLQGVEGFEHRTKEILAPLFFSLLETKVPKEIVSYLNQMEEDRYADLTQTEEGEIAMHLMKMYELGTGQFSPGELASQLKHLNLSARKIGSILKQFDLERSRTSSRVFYKMTPKSQKEIAQRFRMSI